MTLSLIPGEALSEDQITAQAWTHVAEGFERALTIRGLCDEDRACLLRQLRCANALAQRPHSMGAMP